MDDIDHLSNRRVRTVGEQLSNQFAVGLALSLIHISISGVKPRTDFIKAIKYLFLIKFLI